MKEHESHETTRRFLRFLPVYARIDGRGFSRFTRDFERPYDQLMTTGMLETTKRLVKETHALFGYTQSDEISLVWLSDGVFFDRKIMKAVSVLAGLTTSAFADYLVSVGRVDLLSRLPHFDARVIDLPNKTEVANMILWREMDATKNAVSMAARAYYSHKALQNKSGPEMQEMLFQKGINFNDYPPEFKRGSFVRRILTERTITAEELSRIQEQHRPAPDTLLYRSDYQRIDMPKFVTVKNREGVIFDGEAPVTE